MKMHFLLYKEKHRAGYQSAFTLIETLVAIALFSAVLVSFAALVVTSIQASENIKRKNIGLKIAQEGMEIIINKRDNNVLCQLNESCNKISHWQKNLLDSSGGAGVWEVDAAEINQQQLPEHQLSAFNPSHILCLSTKTSGSSPGSKTQGKFTYKTPCTKIPGEFTRKITISPIQTPVCPGNCRDKVLVESHVEWNARFSKDSVVLQAVLFGPE